MNVISGTVSFASYIGNAIRYDIELDHETIFKVDVQNPWDQQPFPIRRTGLRPLSQSASPWEFLSYPSKRNSSACRGPRKRRA